MKLCLSIIFMIFSPLLGASQMSFKDLPHGYQVLQQNYNHILHTFLPIKGPMSPKSAQN